MHSASCLFAQVELLHEPSSCLLIAHHLVSTLHHTNCIIMQPEVLGELNVVDLIGNAVGACTIFNSTQAFTSFALTELNHATNFFF